MIKSAYVIPAKLLLGSVSFIAMSTSYALAETAPASPPVAQTAPAPEQNATPVPAAADPSGQDVVVTGSRIVSNGYQAPTPVTVATAENLLKSSPNNIADGLNKLPQFIGSSGPNRSNNVFATPNHGNLLNLRGLDPIRTLILFDGNRVAPTTYLGTVDVDLMPQLLIQRVDVVTAGASSAYGSDAVAGVVNFVLDPKFNGFKGVVQGGVSSRGDNGQNRIAVAGGFNVGSRGHIEISLDHTKSDGYLNQDRPYLDNQAQAVGSVLGSKITPGQPGNPLIFVPGLRSSLASFGGVATTGPFANTVFLTPTTYRAANTGTPTGTPGFYVGGDYYYGPGNQSASAATENNVAFARGDYDVTNSITAFAQVTVADSVVRYNSLPNLVLTPPIFSGNAFLPAALQDELTATNTPSFTLHKALDEMGPIPAREHTRNYFALGGLKGDISHFKWSLDYSYGESDFHFTQPNQLNETKFAAALDAVRDPSGNIVCRPTLDPDPAVRARYAGCVPFNPFGEGASSQAARNYVTGTSVYRAVTKTNDANFNISGDLFSLPAGAVSIALGAEYRTESLNLTSNSDPSIAQDLTGLRGLASNITPYYLTNVGPAHGSENVKEVFGELAVPILRDKPFFQNLDLNGAVRYTDYSTSGGVTTWKLGGTWAPIHDLRFRVTRSRDIRAPTLFDLFAGAQFTQAASFDPVSGLNGPYNQVSAGNPDLKPEIGNTWSIGFVAQPSFLPGFALSVDGYSVKITGAIYTLTAAQELLDCQQSGGTAPSCDNIHRPSPGAFPSQVDVIAANISQIKTRGIDVDASYHTRLGAGQLALRLYGTYVDQFQKQQSATQPVVEYAGFSTAGIRGADTAVPNLKGTLSVNYDIGAFGFFAQENAIGRIKLGPENVYAEPDLHSFWTTDMTLTVRPKAMPFHGEFFFTVSNLFDAMPPLFNSTTAPGIGLSTIQNLYDTTGRQFTAGVRASF